MKNRVLELVKKTISVVAVCAVVASGVVVPAYASNAEYIETENTSLKTVYREYTYEQFDAVRNEVPTYTPSTTDEHYCANGYLFGGWFTKSDNTYTAMTESDKNAKTTGSAYAKFVPAYVMGVKCQNLAGTSKTMQGNTALKIVSAIDTPNYRSVGFEMDIINLKADGSFEKETPIDDKTGINAAYKKFKVYDSIDATTPVETFEANALFGNEAGYFTTWGVTDIPTSMFGTIICIRPSWVTIDGTTVYGLTKYARVDDGLVVEENGSYYRYLSVPVNVRNTVGGIAAGVLSVDYPQELTFAGFEGGRVFEEMAAAEKTNSIKMVGNVADISTNKTVDDIYANLRFKVSFDNEKEASATLRNYSFTVSDEDFSNISEAQFKADTYNVWDVKY